MKAVTNAGPLIALGKLGLIQLLNQLFYRILVLALVRSRSGQRVAWSLGSGRSTRSSQWP